MAPQATSSQSIPSATSSSLTSASTSAKQGSTGLSNGAVAGIAIAAAVIGALLAAGVLTMLQKKRSRKSRKDHGFAGLASGNRQTEKSGPKGGGFVSEQPDFDLDRLLPQPLDDATITDKAQNWFSQIDSHVESFYVDTEISASAMQAVAGHAAVQMLSNPSTRLFMIKKIICQTTLESVSLESPSDTSFLPGRFSALTRQLKEPNLADHATALSWSRLRTSFAFLLKPDSVSDQTRLDQAISTVVERLNQQLRPFQKAGTKGQRTQDLDAICQSTTELGKTLLGQPATWKFEWPESLAGAGRAASQNPRSQLAYFPALIRLTDNKARKLQSPNVVLQPKIMH